jgi:hypothetical protein
MSGVKRELLTPRQHRRNTVSLLKEDDSGPVHSLAVFRKSQIPNPKSKMEMVEWKNAILKVRDRRVIL